MEEEPTTLSSASTVVSHPEHILLPEFTEDSTQSSISSSSLSPDEELEVARVLSHLESEASFLMSETEAKEEDERLAQCQENLRKQQENYESWENSMNKRKQALFERLQHLKQFHKSRIGFYEDFKTYTKVMKLRLRNTTDAEKRIIQKT